MLQPDNNRHISPQLIHELEPSFLFFSFFTVFLHFFSFLPVYYQHTFSVAGPFSPLLVALHPLDSERNEFCRI